jgi:hypothetical protein
MEDSLFAAWDNKFRDKFTKSEDAEGGRDWRKRARLIFPSGSSANGYMIGLKLRG